MEETTKTPSGVQNLIDRIRDQGVQAAQEEADRLLREARQRATEIVAQAKAEADATQEKTRAEIEAYRAASIEALRLAARDTVLQLKAGVISRFEEFVKRLVTSATRDKELIRSIVLVLAGHAADEFIKDKSRSGFPAASWRTRPTPCSWKKGWTARSSSATRRPCRWQRGRPRSTWGLLLASTIAKWD